MSLVNSDIYTEMIRGRSTIRTFTVTGADILINNQLYTKNGYNFWIDEIDLATVQLTAKTYTPVTKRYRDIVKKYIQNEMVLFKDYQTKITYRNSSDSPQQFDPYNVDTSIWSNNGTVHPQVDYKLYHDDQIFLMGDLVKYEDKLWRANRNIGLPGKIPSETNWTLFSPSGDLFSSLNYFTAVLGNLSFDTPAYIEQTVSSFGETHFFPEEKYYFNRTYKFDFSNSKLIYFSNNGSVLDENYNWITGNFIAEIRYYFDGTEVSRTRYISDYENRSDRKITLIVKRSNTSMLALDGISDTSSILYGTNVSTTGGTMLLYNNNDEISQNLIVANDLDNQNIPIRISDYGKYGHCLASCIKNVEEGSYGTPSYAYIDLISEGLIDTWFNDKIFAYIASQSFVSLPSSICRSIVPIGDRYISDCYTSTGDNVNYCDYLYRIPKLTPSKYGVPFCTNFDLANTTLLYFIPIDVDSQDFLKYEIISSSIIKSNDFFSRSEYIIDAGFFRDGDTYSALTDNIVIGARKTYIKSWNFSSKIKVGDLYHLKDNEDNEVTLQVDQISLGVKDVPLTMNASNFEYCWGTNSDGNVWFYGFLYNESGDNFRTSDIQKLGYIDFIPNELTLNVISGSMIIDFSTYTIEKFTLTKGDVFNLSSVTKDFTFGDLIVSISVNDEGRIYQQGEVNYTGTATPEDILYYKYKGDRCLCKIYVNSNGSNGYLSYLEDNKLTDLSGNTYIPIFYNANKEGILEPPRNTIAILSGDTTILTDVYMDTFVIEDGTIKPNPVQKPFNLTPHSEFYPGVIGESFGIVSSTTSPNLYVTPLSDFDLVQETNTTEFFNFINGDEITTVLNNQTLINSMLRLNKYRPNYPDDIRECNIFLGRSILLNNQASYEVETNKFGFLEIKGSISEIDMYVNNSLTLTQNSKPRYPLIFLVDGKVITEGLTSYSKNQFLNIQYYLDDFQVNRAIYIAQGNLNSAERVRIDILYETKLDSDTSPVNSEITLGERGNFSIKILDNN